MSIWAYPETPEKARQVAALLCQPLPTATAKESLSGLVGDDDLFDLIENDMDDGPADGDQRRHLLGTLSDWLGRLDYFRPPFEPEAVQIIKDAIENANTVLDAELDTSLGGLSA